MGVSQALTKNIRRDYSQAFGHANQRIVLANHTLVGVDAPSLVDEDYRRAAEGMLYDEWEPLPGGAIEFVEALPVG